MKKGNSQKKYIFITGGVSSSLGKGLAAASIASLLERRGLKIKMLKMDPYINVDPGTMSPIQHGEVFVTDDGAETDLDLGHYERFTSLTLSKRSNFTTGQVYLEVIDNERKGKYLGKTVQVVPHITDEIKRRINYAAEDCDLLFGEIGGTVGDIESLPFLEAIRQFSYDVGPENVLFIHLVLIPYIAAAGELKSKPAQHSIKDLRSIGLFPNIILCRSDREIDSSIMEKISLFGNVKLENVFHSIDLDSIYKAPLTFFEQGLDAKIIDLLGMWTTEPNIEDLKQVAHNVDNPTDTLKIGIIGKYTDLIESYKSLDEALKHGAIHSSLKIESVYIDSEDLEKDLSMLKDIQGIIVPGGFGERGTEGKIKAIEYARVNKIPFLGICLGMQLAVIEYSRNVAGLKNAGSAEFKSEVNVIHFMKDQDENIDKGGTMRLGAYDCHLKKSTLAQLTYNTNVISERHRHRLEVNNEYISILEEHGLIFSGINKELDLVEIIEIKDHPFFIACQFHPEFKSKPVKPHPLFRDFIIESKKFKRKSK